MKRLILILVLVVPLQTSTEVLAKTSYENHVERLTYIKIVQGDENSDLQLDKPITRAEACAVIARISGYEDIEDSLPFVDVPKEHWAYSYLKYAYSKELIRGVSIDRFAPNECVTYAQTLQLIINALGYDSMTTEIGFPTGALYVGTSYLELEPLDNHYADDILTRNEVFNLINQALDKPISETRKQIAETEFLWDRMKYERFNAKSVEYSKDTKTLKIDVYDTETGETETKMLIAELDYPYSYYETPTWSVAVWIDNSNVLFITEYKK